MKRAIFVLGCLLLACPVLVAADKPVVVDPMDLRQPVPDPERELTEKYDGKVVVFTGQLLKFGQEGNKKTHWYELGVDPYKNRKAGAKKDADKDLVVVRVYFQHDEKRLRGSGKPTVTVEGKGEITVDGSLVIYNAVIVNGKTPPEKR